MGSKLKRGLLAAAGAVGAAGVASWALSERDELEQPLPGRTGTYRWRGMDVAYVEYGDPDDEDLLLLHGINAAGTSKEFEPIWEELAEEYHVIAPDLPGFGRSDRPPLVYSASLYGGFVEDFAADVADEPTCIASSLTGAYAVEAARDRADLFSRLVLICPTASTMPGGRKLWVRTLLRSPVVGEGLFCALASRFSIDYFSADHGYYDTTRKPEGMADYQYRSAHRPGARFAPASFVGGFLDPDVDLGAAIDDLAVPVTLVWGRETEITPLSQGRDLADRAETGLVVVDYAKLLPHAEHPEEFLDAFDRSLETASA